MTYSHHYPPKPPEGFLVVHKDEHNSYQYLDSISGMARFLLWYGKPRKGVRPGMDLDINGAAGGVWMAHWNAALQHYFKGWPWLSRASFRLTRSTAKAIRSLRSTHKDSRGVRIVSVSEGIRWVAKHDRTLVMLLEAKNLISQATFERLRKVAENNGVTLIVMGIDDWPSRGSRQATLKAAHRAGLYTMILARGEVHPSYFTVDSVTGLPWLDYGKGSRGNYVHAPKGFKRVGLGYGDATAWGAGCHRSTVAKTKDAIAKAHARNIRW